MNIIQGFPTPQKDYYKVYVRSCTFNQAKYIEDCLNGVAMQDTNFPFVHQVIDDASTDGELNVIKAWMDKICDMEHAEYYDNDICTITIVKNKNNPNCTLAAYFLKKNMYGNPKKRELFTPWREVCPYEALCEGDDYWTDNHKLQKQVDILDNHNEYIMVYTGFEKVLTKDSKINNFDFWDNLKNRSFCGYHFDKLIREENFIMTLTIMVRSNVLKSKIYRNSPISLDYLLFLSASTFGDLYYLPDVTSAYRFNPCGMTQSQYDTIRTDMEAIKNYFIVLFLRKNLPLYVYRNSMLTDYEYTCIAYEKKLLTYRSFYKLWKNPKACYFLIKKILGF